MAALEEDSSLSSSPASPVISAASPSLIKKRGFFARFFGRKPGDPEAAERKDYNSICKLRDREKKDFYLTQAQLAILHQHAEEFSATPSVSLSSGPNSNGHVVFSAISELPADVRGSIDRMKVPEEELAAHLDTLANILSFCDKLRPKRKFITAAQQAVFSAPDFNREQFLNRHAPACFVPADELFKPLKVREVKKMFKISDFLGDGGFGNVVAAKVVAAKQLCYGAAPGSKGGAKQVAIKYQEVGSSQTARTLVAHEASFLRACSHPTICALYDCLQVQTELWIVTELLEGGTLKEAAAASSQWGEPSIAYVAGQMLQGIAYLHEHHMVHRDLKNLNVMFTVHAEVKLIDFGLCADLSRGPTVAMLGSPFWMAPEMIKGAPHSFPVDVWSFMVCMLELANRRPPDCKNARRALWLHAIHGMGPTAGLEKPAQWSAQFLDFLQAGFNLDPDARPTASQLLQHPFLEKPNSRENMSKMLSSIFLEKSVAAGGIL